jgi:hypothetical protein
MTTKEGIMNKTDIPTGIYFDAEQMTVREGNYRVMGIATGLGWLGDIPTANDDDDITLEACQEASDWLNSNESPEGYYWDFYEGSFGLWQDDDGSGN